MKPKLPPIPDVPPRFRTWDQAREVLATEPRYRSLDARKRTAHAFNKAQDRLAQKDEA